MGAKSAQATRSNMEVDLMARYVARLSEQRSAGR